MVAFERLVGEVKQLPPDAQKRLLEILQQEVATQPNLLPHLELSGLTIPETINLDAVDPELKWLMRNGWVLQKYRGEYIALKGDELIAHGTLGEVLAESKRRGIDHPFTQYIPKTEREWLLGQGNYPID